MPDKDEVIKDAEHAIAMLGNLEEPTPECDFIRVSFEDTLALLKEQEPVAHATWLGKGTSTAYDLYGVKTWAARYKCSKCGFVHRAIEAHMSSYSYCPSCGARMDEEIKEGEVGCLTGRRC